MNPRIDVVVPAVGYADLRVVVWLFEPGDRVYAGDRLMELMTPGAVCDVAAPANGQLSEQLVFAGDTVRPGQKVGVVISDAE